MQGSVAQEFLVGVYAHIPPICISASLASPQLPELEKRTPILFYKVRDFVRLSVVPFQHGTIRGLTACTMVCTAMLTAPGTVTYLTWPVLRQSPKSAARTSTRELMGQVILYALTATYMPSLSLTVSLAMARGGRVKLQRISQGISCLPSRS